MTSSVRLFSLSGSLKIYIEAAYTHGKPEPFKIKYMVEYDIRNLLLLVRKIWFQEHLPLEDQQIRQSHCSLNCQASIEIFLCKIFFFFFFCSNQQQHIFQHALQFMPNQEDWMSVLVALKLHYPPKRVYVCSSILLKTKLENCTAIWWSVAKLMPTLLKQSVCIMYSDVYLHNLNVGSFLGMRIMTNRLILFLILLNWFFNGSLMIFLIRISISLKQTHFQIMRWFQ